MRRRPRDTACTRLRDRGRWGCCRRSRGGSCFRACAAPRRAPPDAGGPMLRAGTRLRALWGVFPVVVRVHSSASVAKITTIPLQRTMFRCRIARLRCGRRRPRGCDPAGRDGSGLLWIPLRSAKQESGSSSARRSDLVRSDSGERDCPDACFRWKGAPSDGEVTRARDASLILLGACVYRGRCSCSSAS